ncbi:MAG: DUF4097 family beta strand repeat-containing protein [Acidobacteriota bacterium]
MAFKSKENQQTAWGYQTNPLNEIAPRPSRRKKNWLPFIGGMLIVGGLIFFAATSGIVAAKWLLGLWPLFTLIAGVAAVMGFAVERKPRSPFLGMLLIFIGVLFLAARLHSDLYAVQIYGRYWIVLLAIFAIIELIRIYSHPKNSGKPVKLFSFGKVLMLGFIIGTGILANHVSANPGVLASLTLPRWLSDLRDMGIGEKYGFTDEAITLASIPTSAKIIVNNDFGDVSIVGVTNTPKAILTKQVRGWNHEAAKNIADQIKVKVDKNSDGSFTISTNRTEVEGRFETDLQLELPATADISLSTSYGTVSAQNIQNNLAIKSSYSVVKTSDIKGDLLLTLRSSSVEGNAITGDVKIIGAKNIDLEKIGGDIQINARYGNIKLNQIAGELKIEAPYSSINVRDAKQLLDIKTEHGNVELQNTGGATIDAPSSDIQATNINGDLKIESAHRQIDVTGVSGMLLINAPRTDISADDLRGNATIETTHGGVTVKNFRRDLTIKTSFKDVQLIPAADFSGDIDVENSRGEIELTLPQSASYQLDAESEHGKIRTDIPGEDPEIKKIRRYTDYVGIYYVNQGIGGPNIKLRTTFKTITVKTGGQVTSEIPVKAAVN